MRRLVFTSLLVALAAAAGCGAPPVAQRPASRPGVADVVPTPAPAPASGSAPVGTVQGLAPPTWLLGSWVTQDGQVRATFMVDDVLASLPGQSLDLATSFPGATVADSAAASGSYVVRVTEQLTSDAQETFQFVLLADGDVSFQRQVRSSGTTTVTGPWLLRYDPGAGPGRPPGG